MNKCHNCLAETSLPAPYKAYVECGECGAKTAATAAAQPVSAQPEHSAQHLNMVSAQPAGEVPEVVGYQWLNTGHYRRKIPSFVDQSGAALWRALMPVAQHARIVAALQAGAVDPLEWSRKHGIEEY